MYVRHGKVESAPTDLSRKRTLRNIFHQDFLASSEFSRSNEGDDNVCLPISRADASRCYQMMRGKEGGGHLPIRDLALSIVSMKRHTARQVKMRMKWRFDIAEVADSKETNLWRNSSWSAASWDSPSQ